MTTNLLLNPEFYEGIGVIAFTVSLLLGYYKYPKKYKRVWKALKKLCAQSHHIIIMSVAVLATFTLAIIGLCFYKPEAVEAVRIGAPEFYSWILSYLLVLQVSFVGIFAVEWWVKAFNHYSESLDNGIIDDPDVEKRFLRTDLLINQMEKNRSEEMTKMQAAIDKLAEVVVTTQQTYYIQGKRFAENPLPPEGTQERRTIVRNDPSIPVTKEEVIATILPKRSQEETDPQETILLSETLEKKEETIPTMEFTKPTKEEYKPQRKLSWLHLSDWDEKIFGK